MNKDDAKALRQPFPPELVGQLPKAGIMLRYVGHAAVTDRLLQVDPSWTWEPFALDSQGLPVLDKAGNLWIRLTVCGVTKPAVGDGKNAKELISDALRNGAMRFGVALDLWSKEDLSHARSAADFNAALAQLDDITDLDLLRSLHSQAVALGDSDAIDRITERGHTVRGDV